jgi:hypothetical protein
VDAKNALLVILMKKKIRKPRVKKKEVRDDVYKVIKSSESEWLLCFGYWDMGWNWKPISVHYTEAEAEKEIRSINSHDQE